MTIRSGESGRAFRYGTSFDMSANTALELKFVDTSGNTLSVTNPRVTAPSLTVIDPDVGELLANTYMEFVVITTDFPATTVAVTWTVCGVFTNDSPDPDQIFHGTPVTFVVGASC